MKKNDDMQRAINLADAVQISPRRWAYFDDNTRRWYVVSSKIMKLLANYLDTWGIYAYSRWCADTLAKEMPHGWEPYSVR